MKKKRTIQSPFSNPWVLTCLGIVFAFVVSVQANVITVTNTNDSGPGSLRQALMIANDGDTITFTVTGTITLTSGGLLIAKNITISGPGSNQLSVDGNQAVLVFGIFPGKTATISGLTIRNAEAGVWNEQGTLNLNNCVLSANSDVGLYSYEGITTASNCVVSGNSQGGLVNDGPHGGPPPPNDPIGAPLASMTIADSTISNNSGPGVANMTGFLTVLNSTL